jgi:hypothetical protein
MTFRPIQLILIVLVISVLVLYFNRLRSGILDRVVILLFAIAGIIMAAVPDVTMKLAALVGVGRGADLFMYLALVGVAFFGLVIYSKLRELESTVADLARTIAVRTPHRPASGTSPEESGE